MCDIWEKGGIGSSRVFIEMDMEIDTDMETGWPMKRPSSCRSASTAAARSDCDTRSLRRWKSAAANGTNRAYTKQTRGISGIIGDALGVCHMWGEHTQAWEVRVCVCVCVCVCVR